MRTLLACLLVVGVVACGDDESSPMDGGAAASGGGASGKGGSGSAGTGKGGSGSAGKGGAGTSGMAGGAGGASGHAAGGSGSGGSGGTAGTMGMIKLVPNVIAGKQTGSAGSGGIGSQQNSLRVGSPGATTLLSLKYYVTSIQLCEDAELMGSGFKSIAGCIQLYQNMPAGSPDYNEYTVPEAKDDTTAGRYIDLMSAEGQATLRKPVTLQVPVAEAPVQEDVDAADGGVSEPAPRQTGVYRYGLINFYRPIKVKAEFPILGEPSDHYFRTKAVTMVHEIPGMNGGFANERVDIGDTLNGATEETTYMLSNGGALFVFQKPFAITQADIDAKKEINIDLVFNPENFGQAYQEADCSADQRVVICDPTNNVAIDMPFVHMSPVPRKTGEKTRKETYLVDYDSNAKLRIELYYNDADAEAGVQGVDTAIVYDAGTPAGSMPSFNTIASNFVSQTGSVTTNDASVSLMDYQRSVNLEGLLRRQAGTVTVHCLFPGSICSTLNETFTRAYTYVGDTVVSGN